MTTLISMSSALRNLVAQSLEDMMGSGGMRLLPVVDEVLRGVRISEEAVVLAELTGWALRVGVTAEEVVED